MSRPSRASSIAGWAIGWAIAASALWLWPAARLLRASEFVAAILAIGVAAVGIGVGAYLAASARAGSTAESRSPKAEAVVWAIAFAGAALFLTAAPSEEFAKPGEVNAVTWPPPLGPSHSRSGIQFSPVQIRVFEAVPAFGAVGGFFAAFAGTRRRSIVGDGLRAIGAAAIWIVAVVAAAVALMIGGYLLLSTVGRALSPLSPIVSLLVATVMAGGLAGGVAGVIAEPWHQPAGGPSDADLATSV